MHHISGHPCDLSLINGWPDLGAETRSKSGELLLIWQVNSVMLGVESQMSLDQRDIAWSKCFVCIGSESDEK